LFRRYGDDSNGSGSGYNTPRSPFTVNMDLFGELFGYNADGTVNVPPLSPVSRTLMAWDKVFYLLTNAIVYNGTTPVCYLVLCIRVLCSAHCIVVYYILCCGLANGIRFHVYVCLCLQCAVLLQDALKPFSSFPSTNSLLAVAADATAPATYTSTEPMNTLQQQQQQQRGTAAVDHNTEGFQQAGTTATNNNNNKTGVAAAAAANAMSDDDVLSSIMDEDYLIWASVMEAAPTTLSRGNSVSVPWSPFLDSNNNGFISSDGTILDLSPSPLNFNSKGLLPASHSGNDITNDVLVLPPSISQMSHHQQQQQSQVESSGASAKSIAGGSSGSGSSGSGGGVSGKAKLLSLDIDDINNDFSSSCSTGNDGVAASTSCFFEDPLRRARYIVCNHDVQSNTVR
jgi:uncharacterized membrane protein YgcG